MENEKVFAMSFSKVYGLLIAKAERKGRTRAEVEEVTSWLTGYTAQQIDNLMDSEISYGDFFRQAPAMNPNREKITGVVCGVRVENVENPLMRDIRYLESIIGICVENAGSNGRVIKEDSAQNRYIDFQDRLSGEGGRSFFVPLSQLEHFRQPLRNAESNVNTVKEGNSQMLEIKGKVNTAICYAKVIEDEAIDQIRRMCDYDMTAGSKIRIMPDVHAGKGCTIGTTMTIVDNAVPNVVGVDIGCGMYTVNLGKVEIDFEKLDEACHFIPSGMNVWEGRQERFDLTELRCYRNLKDTRRLERSLGTLGGGNHFIEVDEAEDRTKYLIIHSGSRNLGKQVAELYQKLAVDFDRGYGEYFEKRDEIIRTYKEQGRRKEIQAALKELHFQVYESQPSMPNDLCYLSGKYLEDYLHDVVICQRFARRSREKMAEIILERTGMTGADGFHTIHNYIDTDEMILRKGAIAAHKGEKVLIPINMRDGSVLAVGKGNHEWNYSAPHGAGRIMSRTKAKNELSLDQYKEEMAGVYTTSVNENTLDEAPMAYKSLEDIIDVIRESVDVIDVMKPIYNYKASD